MGTSLWVFGGYIALSILAVVLCRYLSPFGEDEGMGEELDVVGGSWIAIFAPIMLLWWVAGWSTVGVFRLCRGRPK